jgi:hypothetical protein
MEEFETKYKPPILANHDFTNFKYMLEHIESVKGFTSTFTILSVSANYPVNKIYDEWIQKNNGRMYLLDENKQELDQNHKQLSYSSNTIDGNVYTNLQSLSIDPSISPFHLLHIECKPFDDPHETALDVLEKVLCILPKVHEKTLIVINILNENNIEWCSYIDHFSLRFDYKRVRFGGNYVFYKKNR